MQSLVEIEQLTSVWGDKVFVVFVSRLRNYSDLRQQESVDIYRPI